MGMIGHHDSSEKFVLAAVVSEAAIKNNLLADGGRCQRRTVANVMNNARSSF